jgi:uncharacterized protein YabN with tetrapyrrole methylase and pyrophosphatase domain
MSTNSFVNILDESGHVMQVRYDLFVMQLLKADTQDMMRMHVGLGIASEAGEVADCIKKEVIYRKPPDRKHLVEELGDLRFYMEAAMSLYGIEDQEVLQENANKLSRRYQSLTYSDTAALARADKSPT